jgi:hypothetical protein
MHRSLHLLLCHNISSPITHQHMSRSLHLLPCHVQLLTNNQHTPNANTISSTQPAETCSNFAQGSQSGGHAEHALSKSRSCNSISHQLPILTARIVTKEPELPTLRGVVLGCDRSHNSLSQRRKAMVDVSKSNHTQRQDRDQICSDFPGLRELAWDVTGPTTHYRRSMSCDASYQIHRCRPTPETTTTPHQITHRSEPTLKTTTPHQITQHSKQTLMNTTTPNQITHRSRPILDNTTTPPPPCTASWNLID